MTGEYGTVSLLLKCRKCPSNKRENDVLSFLDKVLSSFQGGKESLVPKNRKEKEREPDRAHKNIIDYKSLLKGMTVLEAKWLR